MGLKSFIIATMSLLTGCSGSTNDAIAWESPTQYEAIDLQSPDYARAIKAIVRAQKGDAIVYYKLGNMVLGGVTTEPSAFARDAGYKTRYFAVLLDPKRDRAIALPNPDLYDQFVENIQNGVDALSTDAIASTLLLLGRGSFDHISQKMLDEMDETEARGLFAPKLHVENGSLLRLDYCSLSQSPMTRPVATICSLTCTPHQPSLECSSLDDDES